MTPELEEIYLQALQLDSPERERYLDGALAGADEDRRMIDNLLSQQNAAGSYFEGLGDRFNTLLEEEEPVLPEKIGDYQPTRLLGRGGMGEVYLASRSDGQFDQEVAIKVLPAALAEPQSAALFLRERQILAGLDHPNICQLFDGGMSDNGTPYFVMEHIEGRPIDEYADQNCLSIEARLGLFLQVCSAVEHAHQNLTLHRDIKPANILVAESGQVKLLDFGVAKIVGESNEENPQPLTTHLPVTPKFAAPEQLLGQPVSTRTDVYGLGMLLYWLLAGVDAHKLSNDNIPKNLRVLSEEDATLASRRLNQLLSSADSHDHLETIARQRQLNAKSLVDRLSGDLENILAKSLKRQTGERYATAGALAEDIQRHLTHRPVMARPDTFTYSASRFIRRHRVPVALSAVIAALVLALSGGVAWFAWKQKQQNQALVEQTARADATKDFLVTVFQQAHPNNSKGETLTAMDLLSSGAQRAQQELGDQPQLQADLNDTFASIYSVLGNYALAEELWGKELLLREQLAGAQSADYADVLINLSRIAAAQGQQDKAVELGQQSIAIRLHIDDPLGLANSRFRIARLATNAGDLDLAEETYRQVLPVFASHHPESADQHTMSLIGLGNVLRQRGEYDESLALVEQAVTQQLKINGELEAFTSQVLQDLGATQRAMGNTIEAEESYQRALRIAEEILGPDHREVGFALSGLAQLAEANGDIDLSEKRRLRSLEIFANLLRPGHPNIGITKLGLGAFYIRQGSCSKAQSELREGLEIVLAALPTHNSVAKGQRNLANCIRDSDPVEAEQLMLSAYETQLDRLGDQHIETQKSAADLLSIYQQLGQTQNAADIQSAIDAANLAAESR